jgi:cytochrome c-type biogenesis protein CcmE
MRDGINFFRAPAQMMADPPGPDEVFRIGGLVEEGSHRARAGRDGDLPRDRWRGLHSGDLTGVLPDLSFRRAGHGRHRRLVDGVFVAPRSLPHDETYMPKEVMDALKEQGVYKDPDAPSG